MANHDPLAYWDSLNPQESQARVLAERILILRQKVRTLLRINYVLCAAVLIEAAMLILTFWRF